MTEQPTPQQHPIETRTKVHQEPLVVEQEGKRLVVVSFTDLDGTANDETLPEQDRLATIGPARQALSRLESNRILAGINTGRSFGEAEEYRRALGIQGPIICEDGAVVIFPEGINPLVAKKTGAVEHDGKWALVLSKVNREAIARVIEQTSEEAGKPFINTVTSTPEEIMKAVGHSSARAAELSADRLSSGFIVGLDPKDTVIAQRIAAENGMRTFAEPMHLIGTDAHKGHALREVNEHVESFFPGLGVQGILPIAFGNNVNDVAFMETCREINGGIGVLVGKPGGGFFVDEAKIPDYVIKTKEPYGKGMVEAVPQILNTLNSRFSLNLK